MAAFRKLSNGKWFVRVRRTGFPEQSQAFSTRPEAELWGAEVESSMLRGSFISTKESERTTLSEAWDRYLREITPLKKGANRERTRIMKMQKSSLGCRFLASVQRNQKRLTSACTAFFSSQAACTGQKWFSGERWCNSKFSYCISWGDVTYS